MNLSNMGMNPNNSNMEMINYLRNSMVFFLINQQNPGDNMSENMKNLLNAQQMEIDANQQVHQNPDENNNKN
jgi:hypothetical protein